MASDTIRELRNAVKYAASSSDCIGTSVTDYLNIPQFDKENKTMVTMSQMAKRFKRGEIPSEEEENILDALVGSLIE